MRCRLDADENRALSRHVTGRASSTSLQARIGSRLLLVSLLLALAACSSGPSPHAGHAPPPDSVAANGVLMRALGLVGTPYRYGGNSPAGGFDCSGLVQFVFHDSAGVRLPRSTRELVAMDAPEVDRRELQPGDLVFFNPGGGKASHIGIYVGEGRFVHAPSTGGTVRLDQLDADYWRRTYAGARRVL
jgi:cell wall-associated NlpC family hydrolase